MPFVVRNFPQFSSSRDNQLSTMPNIWLHCNKCFLRAEGLTQQFFITKCGHVLCYKCSQLSNAQMVCSVCSETVSLRPLNKNVPAEIASYFQPSTKILEFQIKNMENLIKNYILKFNSAKKELIRLKQAYQHQKKEIIYLKGIIQSMKDSSNPPYPFKYFNGMDMAFSTETSMNMTNPTFDKIAMPNKMNPPMLPNYQLNYPRARTARSNRSRVGRSAPSLAQIFAERNHI